MAANPPMSINPLIGREYRSFDGQRKWELQFETVRIVILDHDVSWSGQSFNLVGFDATSLRLIWAVPSPGSHPGDGFIEVGVRNGQVWGWTFSCFHHVIDYQTGVILQKVWTK